MNKLKNWPILIPLLLIGIYVCVASYNLSSPGLHYDEVLFTNAALGPIDNTFVDVKIGPIPVMLMGYIGALKAYLYFPIFKLFGVSAFTIRFPTIILSAVGLYVLYLYTLRVFGKKTALITLLISILDPLFISHSRLDMGPTVISYVCKAISLYFFILFLKKKKLKYIIGVGVSLLLGVFNKFNFLWFSLAFIVAALLFYRVQIVTFYKKTFSINTQKILIGFTILLILTGIYVMERASFLDSIDFFYLKHFFTVITAGLNTLNGQIFLKLVLGMGKPITPLYVAAGWLMTLFIIGIVGLRLILPFKKPEEKYSFYFLMCIAAIIYFQIIITSKAGASWHLFELYPFIPLLFGVSLTSLLNGKKLLIPIIVAVLLYHAAVYSLYVNAYNRSDIGSSWSKDIYQLIDYTKKQNKIFISMDWGIHNQLQVFDHVKGKYVDGWIYTGKKFPDSFYNPGTQILFHNKKTTSIKASREDFFNRLPSHRKLQLKERVGIYEVWEVVDTAP